MNTVWIFNGENARFASGTFSCRELAEMWIAENGLSGVLTEYPLDMSAYEWAVENEYFVPKTKHHKSPDFIGGFTSASQSHFHYKNGVQA